MDNKKEDDLIILDDSGTKLDSEDNKEKNDSEINFNDLNGNGGNEIILDDEKTIINKDKEDESIDLLNLTSDVEEVNEENQEENQEENLLVDSSINKGKDETIDLMGSTNEEETSSNFYENNFDLDQVTRDFIEKLDVRKGHISALIKDNESNIKNLDEQITQIKDKILVFKSKIEDLNKENEKINSRISLLNGDLKNNSNRKK